MARRQLADHDDRRQFAAGVDLILAATTTKCSTAPKPGPGRPNGRRMIKAD
jgi:hypothetical protein